MKPDLTLLDENETNERGEKIFQQHCETIFKQTDKLFGILMLVQWAACILTAVLISPKTWIGSQYAVHIHVWAAVLLGGAVSLFPVLLILFRPGHLITRLTVATAQMLMSALLIHLTGGRIETHFHVFGSLAILAFYRDWRVMIPATIVVALDHAVRGLFFPQSVFGVLTASSWRWVEHAGWVIFEDVFLITSCFRSVGEMKDIAVRRAQLENMNEKIEAEVQRKTEELQKARDAALSASKSKSEFLATMSHEIRTPMNAILGMGELLAEGKLDEEQREYVGTLRRNGEHLLTIINDILDLSKVEVGKLQLESIPFELSDAVGKVADLMAVRAHQKGLELLCRFDSNVPSVVEGDGNRLRQVIMNLVSNAIKFTEKGEVIVEVSLPLDGREIPQDEIEVLFKVRDTGIGIPEEKQDILFGAFNQVDSSTTRKYGGTGLGLSICKKLVELMRGTIGVRSKAGQGSEFYFTARFKKTEVCVKSGTSSELKLQLKGTKVLIVDDNAVNRLVLREMLKPTGASMEEAGDGKSGLQMLRSSQAGQPFNLILLDCRMPGMDGFEFAEQVKKEASFEGVPIMMLTSDDRRAHIERAQAMGLSVYLVKPVKKKDLFLSIQKVIEKKSPGEKSGLVPKEKTPEGTQNAPSSLEILLVEDNLDNRMLIQSYLKKTNFHLDAAVNGLEALDKVKKRTYDVILMDLHMPVMDGYEASTKIRQWEKEKPGMKPAVILALSASALQEEVSKSIDAGCNQHLSKPIAKETLLKVLADYAEGSKNRGESKAA